MSKNSTVIVTLVIGLIIGYIIGVNYQGQSTGDNDTGDGSQEGMQEFSLGNHIQLGLPEQDVFIEDESNTSMVLRVEGEQSAENLAKELFATSETTPHDPFKIGEDPLGPFPKGEALDFTLEEWLAGSGSGTYTTEGETGTITLAFETLIPEGVYTVWCSRLTFPPDVAIVDSPCGAPDGSENTFTADSAGSASITMTGAALTESSEETATVIALAYHSDGLTYGEEPGEFGNLAHVQLAYIMPPPEQE